MWQITRQPFLFFFGNVVVKPTYSTRRQQIVFVRRYGERSGFKKNKEQGCLFYVSRVALKLSDTESERERERADGSFEDQPPFIPCLFIEDWKTKGDESGRKKKWDQAVMGGHPPERLVDI